MDDLHPDGRHLVGGRFRLRELLGSGGTASVFEARDETTGESVALKLLHPHLAEDPALRAAFAREADVLGGVRAGTLAAVVAAGDAHDAASSWTAWERAPGRTLAEHVRRAGRLPTGPAVDVAVGILEAVGALHAAGLVHRDISPSNVVVDLAGARVRSVRVVDFGLVDAAGTTTRGRDVLRSMPSDHDDGAGVVGNVQYASPEQLRGDPVGPRGDLYQVAAVLYFCLVGSAPFAGETTAATVQAHLAAVPPIASVRAPGVPVEVDRAIVRGMLKDPASRFASASAFIHALRAEPGASETDPARPPRTRVLAEAPPVEPAPVFPVGAGVGADRATARAGALWGLALMAGVVVVALVTAFTASPATVGSDAVPRPLETVVAPEETTAPPVDATAPPPPDEPETVSVPALEGQTLAAAHSALDAAGLVAGEVRATPSGRARDTVIASDPAAGTEVVAGQSVTLTVASGSNRVPEVRGMSLAWATEEIEAAGLTPVVSRSAAGAGPERVIATYPAAESVVALGTSVVIEVPAPAPSASPQPSPVPTAAPSPDATP